MLLPSEFPQNRFFLCSEKKNEIQATADAQMPNDFQARENVGIAGIKHMVLWRKIGREKHNCKAELRVFYYSE